MLTPETWAAARLGHGFADPAVLTAALTHRSAGRINYERLEFLGDAVLTLVVSELLYREFTTASEGDLSRYRATLVSGSMLAAIATELGLGEQLRLGGGELKSGGFRRGSILSDALEGVIGAVYVDGGFEAARAVVARLYAGRLERLPVPHELKDAKTRLAGGVAAPRPPAARVRGGRRQRRAPRAAFRRCLRGHVSQDEDAG